MIIFKDMFIRSLFKFKWSVLYKILLYKIFRIIFTLIIIYLTNHSFAFSQNEKIKIGLLAPLSGEYKELGQSIIKSTRMALSDIGTDNIETYPMDTGIDPNQTLQHILSGD